MFYSASTHGFYDPDIHSSIPTDAVEITADQHAALLDAQAGGKIIQPDSNGFPVATDPPAQKAQVPTVITMRQARLALLQSGYLAQVGSYIAAVPGADGDAARITWEFSSQVQRSNPLVGIMQTQLSLTDTQVDDLFTLARSL